MTPVLHGCRENKESPGEAGGADLAAPTASNAVVDEHAIARAGSGPNEDEGAVPAPAWATWSMPNSHLPGLPNLQEYDTSVFGVTLDRVTGLMWQRYPTTKPATFSAARAQCTHLSLAGRNDWRLPSRIELVSIVDLTRSQPAIDPVAFPRTPADWFWTGSVATENPTAAWYVYFYFGYPKTDDVTNMFSVRCVRTPAGRAPAPSAKDRYAVQADTVRDVATGLTWERTVRRRKLDFAAARSYCEHLGLSGQNGWRVPSMPELLTIVDERANAPCIDGAAFPGTAADSFWTSSAFAETAAQAWHVDFDHGNALYGLLNAAYNVRCVR